MTEPESGSVSGMRTRPASSLDLAGELRSRLARGEWSGGEKLPSIRRMSEETGLHRLTVLKAYTRLKNEGLIEAREKSGYYDAAAFASADGRSRGGGFAAGGRAAETGTGVTGYGAAPGEPELPSLLGELHSRDCRYQLSQAQIDPLLLPNSYLAEQAKHVFDLYPRVLGTYAPLRGDDELIGAIGRYLEEDCGFAPEPEELLVIGGAQQGIHLAAEALVRPGDAVLIERPSYSAAIEIFEHRSARIVPVDIYPDGYRLDELEQLMRQYRPVLFYLNPTYHNPTGYCLPPEQRKRLADLAERYDCILLEDDPFRDIYFGPPPPLPIYAYDTSGHTIYLRSFSKYIFPGLRVGCAAAPAHLMRKLLEAKARSGGGTPLLNQKVFVHHFRSERSRQHLHKLRTALLLRKEAMERALRGSGWRWETPKGGLNLWIELPPGLSPRRLLADSLAGGPSPAGAPDAKPETVSFVPGSFFDPSGRSDNRIRLSYSLLSERLIAEGVALLLRCADKARRS
ncbi:PLP-dependent aminotransferase family protein [Saccharibacillus sp. CPCC 101409]|uniref:aminotransferase-like domain-containing protein n=1 Tax=Saccharibacillus sp. CPCC 101409 TaxID=3058041 RepID=UPI002672619F|nr:PLP-dependent aminotransferase family protein [Saccharibacillus sp. CPCC 101409]MDO3408566.1 PLP-dependent aminotransferase family protein [Saccharibacillus sp. CPCC 101409]